MLKKRVKKIDYPLSIDKKDRNFAKNVQQGR